LRNLYDAFWFPLSIRDAIITPDTEYDHLHFCGGAMVDAAAQGLGEETVTVRWPHLDLSAWERIVGALRGNRRRVQKERWQERLPQAVRKMRNIWGDRDNPLRVGVLEGLAACTGYSAGMLDFALGLLDLVSIDDLQQAASSCFTQAVKGEFVSLDELAGRVRFFADGWWQSLSTGARLRFGRYRRQAWKLHPITTDSILGFAAGNVPGTGLLLILLSLATAGPARGEEVGPPIIIVKNSRREPLFTPLVLSALELMDPLLVDTTVVTMWDYTDQALQEYLVGQADLVVAAASDETIDEIGAVVERVSTPARPVRFHRHGHKVSFSTIGRECLEVSRKEPESGVALLEVVALLASLDVALWNQQGCLSSRVHFVERGTGQGYYSPEAYSQAVVESLRLLNNLIPKGVSRKRQIHNLFDKYQARAGGGTVQVCSEYDDDFLVVLERQPLTPDEFRGVVNDCQGRTVVVLPVDDIMEVPRRYLRQMRRGGQCPLQSMSLAVGDPDCPGIAPRLLRYAEALGAVGMTGIRTVGRGAFPQLAYSWDGLIPLDLTVDRPKGYFTALEFDQPWTQIYDTHQLVRRMLSLDEEQV
jgi:Acyl-CoA reductase (LuxC)